jgi:hypothetical protein
MKFSNFKQDKGVAGLSIFLTLITMIFAIGLIVMIFSLMGTQLQSTAYNADTNMSNLRNIGTVDNATYTDFHDFLNHECSSYRFYNVTATDINEVVPANYTIDPANSCGVKLTTANNFTGTWFASYNSTYDKPTTASIVINDTTIGLSTVPDWFPLFIVIGAMVVVILLTVIIIGAIKGFGGFGGSGGGNEGYV